MPSITDRSVDNNQSYFKTLKPVPQAVHESGAPQQVPITSAASSSTITDGYSLSPLGNPSPNRSSLPSQFTYDFDTYRNYPNYFTFRRRWVNQ